MAPSSVPSSPLIAAQAQIPSTDEARRSKSSSGPRDRAGSPGGTVVAPPGAGPERTPGTPADGLEPDWSSAIDAATD